MISSIVYFDEIVENIKDATGIENARPLYDRFKRFVFKTEREIGGGGLIIRKKKSFKKGDGLYDGKTIIMPDDFIGEFSYGSLSLGNITGNVISLYAEGPDEIDLRYMGFVLDEYGNPFTTRHHLNAVVAYSVYRLYSAKLFLKTGNLNVYREYKMEFNDAVLEARGEDAFPTEEEWKAIGKTLSGGAFEALTNCGMKGFPTGDLDPVFVESEVSDAICIYTAYINGISNASSSALGDISFWELKQITGTINCSSSLEGVMFNSATLPGEDRALSGVSNASTNVEGILLDKIIIVQCNESFTYSGGPGTFAFKLVLGEGTGMTGLLVTPYGVPDRFRIEWNGVEVANSKFIGRSTSGWEQGLLDLGYDPSELDLGLDSVSNQSLLFNKTTPTPNFAMVYVDAPLDNTLWKIDGVCPS